MSEQTLTEMLYQATTAGDAYIAGLLEENAQLRAQRDELAAALQPFADVWTGPEELYPLDEDYKRAAEVLAARARLEAEK